MVAKGGLSEHGDFKSLGEHGVSVERLRQWLPISGLAMLSGRALRMVGIAEAFCGKSMSVKNELVCQSMSKSLQHGT